MTCKMIRTLVVLAGGTLAACAPRPPPVGPEFDGRYVGTDRLINGVAFQCGDVNLPEQIAVIGGRFAYPFQVNPPRTAPLPVQVAVDGSVFGQMQYGLTDDTGFLQSRQRIDWVTLTGRITGPTLEATISTLRCTRRLNAGRGP